MKLFIFPIISYPCTFSINKCKFWYICLKIGFCNPSWCYMGGGCGVDYVIVECVVNSGVQQIVVGQHFPITSEWGC